jgi:hypothetical protein
MKFKIRINEAKIIQSSNGKTYLDFDNREIKKCIQEILKTAYPSVKFIVLVSGDRINIKYTDGPDKYELRQYLSPFNGKTFDSQNGIDVYNGSSVGDYYISIYQRVSITQVFSDEVTVKICKMMASEGGVSSDYKDELLSVKSKYEFEQINTKSSYEDIQLQHDFNTHYNEKFATKPKMSVTNFRTINLPIIIGKVAKDVLTESTEE